MGRKQIGLAVLSLLAMAFMWLFIRVGESDRLENYILDEAVYDGIVSGRRECDGELLKEIMFGGESLFYDRMSHTFYYSVPEDDEHGYNPVVTLRKTGGGVKFSVREEGITDELVSSGRKITCMAYNDEAYEPYTLVVTTLPLMSIEAEGYMSDADVQMEMTLFDNRADTRVRSWESAGTISRRGRTTRSYEKTGYKVELSKKLSLLGMRRDDDWVLYAGYNDQEKIRNVFSCNLWKNSCAMNNSFGIDNGVEYRYIELFINGMYEGLYAFGYKIDDKQMGVNAGADNGCIYKKVNYCSEYPVTWTEEGTIQDYEISSRQLSADREAEKWKRLCEFYEGILNHQDDDAWLLESIDLDNSIDMHLFLNLVQGEDNAKGPFTKNMYITARKTEEGGYRYLYTPWDLDITWGNIWVFEEHNYTVPYALTPEDSVIWTSGSLYELLCNGNREVRERYLARYRELRAGAWSEEALLEQLDSFEAQIFDSGAYVRDRERWVNGSYVADETRLSTFKQYVLERLAAMDDYFDRIESGEQDFPPRFSGGEDVD
ncbi:MAG: CotH kinase family protein [Lachnospiraceae bacterium]|nr:CotH kinase family protein [Lachnospiraceae bacterium]